MWKVISINLDTFSGFNGSGSPALKDSVWCDGSTDLHWKINTTTNLGIRGIMEVVNAP